MVLKTYSCKDLQAILKIFKVNLHNQLDVRKLIISSEYHEIISNQSLWLFCRCRYAFSVFFSVISSVEISQNLLFIRRFVREKFCCFPY